MTPRSFVLQKEKIEGVLTGLKVYPANKIPPTPLFYVELVIVYVDFKLSFLNAYVTSIYFYKNIYK